MSLELNTLPCDFPFISPLSNLEILWGCIVRDLIPKIRTDEPLAADILRPELIVEGTIDCEPQASIMSIEVVAVLCIEAIEEVVLILRLAIAPHPLRSSIVIEALGERGSI